MHQHWSYDVSQIPKLKFRGFTSKEKGEKDKKSPKKEKRGCIGKGKTKKKKEERKKAERKKGRRKLSGFAPSRNIFKYATAKNHAFYAKTFSFWGTSSLDPLPGLCPWSPLGDFRPLTYFLHAAQIEIMNDEYAPAAGLETYLLIRVDIRNMYTRWLFCGSKIYAEWSLCW